MKNIRVAFLCLVLAIGLSSCQLFNMDCCMGINQITISSPTTQLRVGETISISVSTPETNLKPYLGPTWAAEAFIYSPISNSSDLAPYAPLSSGGFSAASDPTNFPVQNTIEITSPITGANNVPPRVAATFGNSKGSATFTIRGKAVGTVLLKAGFVLTRAEVPNNFGRFPSIVSAEGTITLQVIL